MSIKAIAWAWRWKQECGGAAGKLVLVALADCANADHLAWPSIKALCEKTGLSRRTVFYVLKKLEAAGALHVLHRRNERGLLITSYYHLAVSGALDALQRCKICTTEVQNLHSTSARIAPLEDPSADPLGDPETGVSGSLLPNGNAPHPDDDKLTPEDLKEGWNEICGKAGLPAVRELTSSRRSKVRQRIKEHPAQEWWEVAMTKIAHSPFCCGQVPGKNGAKPWRASFDWLIRDDTNAVKAYEGRYSDG